MGKRASTAATRRRTLLAGAAAAGFLGLFTRGNALELQGMPAWDPLSGPPPDIVKPGPWQFFTAEEAVAVEALVDRLIPPDPHWAGGKDAGCAVYIDRQLAGPFGRSAGLYMRPPFDEQATDRGPQSPFTPAQRYRRSRIGAFWLTINMGVMIATLGIIFGTLFRSPITDYLPFVCAGLIFWGFLSLSVNEGCATFIEAGGIILQVRMPLFIHIMRVLWRNAIILAHNLVILPLVLLAMGRNPGLHVLLVLPGFLLVVLNVGWIMLVLAVVCTRFRDMTQVAQNFMQVLFYATPIVWMPS
ncbi:MAG: ABC transporter permease, partial [Rhodospirillales bacterium]|nr:ABC transporter permease [Rhodospirillales bacterium]